MPKKTKRIKEREIYIDSNSMVPDSSPLGGRELNAPTVYYSQEAWLIIQHIIKVSTGEIGWLGLVEKYNDYFIIREIFIPEQIVTAVTTEIEPEALLKLTMELLEEGKDTSMLRYWGHSHVNMPVRPSGRDEAQIEDYLEHADWFIRGIYNKKGAAKVDVYDVPGDVLHQCVEHGVIPRKLSNTKTAEIDAILKANISRPKPQIHKVSLYMHNTNNVAVAPAFQSIHIPKKATQQVLTLNHGSAAMGADTESFSAQEMLDAEEILDAEEEAIIKTIDLNISPMESVCVREYMGFDDSVVLTQRDIFDYRMNDSFYVSP